MMTSLKIYRPNTLPGLPLELFLQICDFLSPIDLKCLSFCDRQFFSWLYVRYHGFPPLVGDEKFFILAQLQRDMPDHFACYVCNRLHRYDGSESFGLSGIAHRKSSKLPCDNKTYKLAAELKEGVGMSLRTHSRFEHSWCRLSVHQLKLAMRGFHYPCGVTTGISADSLSYTQVLLYSTPTFDPSDQTYSYTPKITTLFSIQGQIFHEPLGLYIRMQDIVLLQTWNDLRIKSERNPLSLYEVCCHTPVLSKRSDLDRLHYGKKPSLSYTCSRCNTECVIEVLKFGSQIAFLMTRWINLGFGFDHRDPLWTIHARRSSESPSPQRLHRSMMANSPLVCFEGLASETLHSLRSRNLSYLWRKQYKKTRPFVKLCSYMWYIPYQDPLTAHRHGSMWSWLRAHCQRPSIGPVRAFEKSHYRPPRANPITKETENKSTKRKRRRISTSDDLFLFMQAGVMHHM